MNKDNQLISERYKTILLKENEQKGLTREDNDDKNMPFGFETDVNYKYDYDKENNVVYLTPFPDKLKDIIQLIYRDLKKQFITSKLDDSELKWYLNNGGDGDRKYVLRDGTDFNNFIKDQIKKYKGLYFDERPDWRGEVTKEELDAYLKS